MQVTMLKLVCALMGVMLMASMVNGRPSLTGQTPGREF